MIKNYLKIAWRNLIRNKTFSIINVVGLSVGMTCCMLLLLYIRSELTYDKHHEHVDNLYMLSLKSVVGQSAGREFGTSPAPYGPTLKSEYPEIVQFTRLFAPENKALLQVRENGKPVQSFYEGKGYQVDSTFFGMFSYEFVEGSAQSALTDPHSVVVSETVARKLFGNSPALDRTIRISGEQGGGEDYRVSGVYRDASAHSHIDARFFLPIYSGGIGDFLREGRLDFANNNMFHTYLRLRPDAEADQLVQKLPAFVEKYARADLKQYGFDVSLQLVAVPDLHLYDQIQSVVTPTNTTTYLYILASIAIFTLLIACFNFMNLSTARSMQRAREVGLRKSIGAQRSQLVGQFLGESMVLTALAMVLAIGLTAVVLPVFNNWADKQLSMLNALSPLLIVQILASLLVVGLLAGLYPAFFLSAFQPIKVLKGTLVTKAKGGYSLRKTLVVVQFAVSMALIIGAGVVYYQLSYVQRKNLGFNKEQLVILPFQTSDMRNDYQSIKQELLQNPAIESATACYGLPGGMFAGDGVKLPGQDKEVSISMFLIDPDYIPTMGIELVAGRNLSKQYGTDAEEGFLVNETAVKSLGWGTPEQALGKEMLWNKWVPSNPADTLKRGRVIGVVKDFHYKSLHQKIEPLVLHIHEPAYYTMVARVRPEKMSAALDFLKTKWETRAPEFPLSLIHI